MAKAVKAEAGERLKQVIILLSQSKGIKEIACLLGIADKTAQFHWAKCKTKYGFQCYVDAARYAYTHFWSTP